MTRRPPQRARARARRDARAVALAFAGVAACTLAAAGSLETRDPVQGTWTVTENPNDGSDDYIVRHMDAQQQPVARYGQMGVAEFTMGPDNDQPASLRVDAQGRAWMGGTGTTGGRPQPVVMRLKPDGAPDTAWGVQGRVQINPNGLPMRANDLLPLADGRVLVAGEAPSNIGARAVVLLLKPDGTLDGSFGDRGVWQRPGKEGAVAVNLAVGTDGGVVVAVSVRGDKPQGEVWSLYERPPQLLDRNELDDNVDEDELHLAPAGSRFHWINAPGSRGLLVAATLERPAVPAASAPVDPGQGAFSPFTEHPGASAVATPAATAPADDEGGLPWGWIGAAVLAALGLVGYVFAKGGRRAAPAKR